MTLMARVNHKLVKERLDERRSKITDRQFFTSRLLAGHFEDLAMVQSKRYHYNRRVHVKIVWEPKSEAMASTNNDLIQINAGNKFVTGQKGRKERYQIVCGFFTHELGHILYSDFLCEQTRNAALGAGRWYPTAPQLSKRQDFDNEADLLEYIKADPIQKDLVLHVSHLIMNTIEDGYIENRMLLNFPGTLGHGLSKLRKLHLESIPTVTELKEKEEAGILHIFGSVMQMILCYVKFGQVKYGDEPYSDERVQTVFGLLGELDSALQATSPKTRFDIVNRVLIRCWPYAKDYCEKLKKMLMTSGTLDISEDIAGLIKETLGELCGSSEAGVGSWSPIPEDGAEIKLTSSSARDATAKAAEAYAKAEKERSAADPKDGAEGEAKIASGSESPGIVKSEAGTSGASEAKKTEGAEGSSVPDAGDESSVTASLSEAGGEDEEGDVSSSGEASRFRAPDRISVPEGGGIEYNSDYEAGNVDNSAKEIDTLLDKMAELAACKEAEDERLLELNEAAQAISYGNIHDGVAVRVNRINEVGPELMEQYAQIAPSLISISKQLQRSLTHILSDSRKGGKHTGLMLGRRLDARSLHRDDGRVFYKNNLPQELPQLAVGLLLDESGSMGGSRAVYARAAAIILYDFCHALRIPVLVCGHSTSSCDDCEVVNIYSYAEFEDIDGNDRYRLMDIRARGCNRDGAALRYVSERLSKRPEEVKLFIVVSDGQPHATDYSGSPAEEDLRGIKREYQKKGVVFVAAAIGDDKANIERIYGDSFLDITDLKQLPVKLVSVVKKYIKV